MAKQPEAAGGEELRALLGNVARDAHDLLGQQFSLLKAELADELRKAGGAVALVAAGGGVAAAGGLMTGFMFAHLIRRLTGLPLWACFGLAAGGLGAAGAGLLRAGRDRLADVRPLPQTTEALGENIQWLKDRLTPAVT